MSKKQSFRKLKELTVIIAIAIMTIGSSFLFIWTWIHYPTSAKPNQEIEQNDTAMKFIDPPVEVVDSLQLIPTTELAQK